MIDTSRVNWLVSFLFCYEFDFTLQFAHLGQLLVTVSQTNITMPYRGTFIPLSAQLYWFDLPSQSAHFLGQLLKTVPVI